MNIATPILLPGAIHLWELDLDHITFSDVLSEDERARASKFRFDHDRNRYTCGRIALRQVLAAYLKDAPEQIHFTYGPAGKPSIANTNLSFNLAHSGPKALLAITLDHQLGVDIEHMRAIDDMPAVAQYSFAPGEFRRWQSLPADQKTRAFYRCWTRKEAFLKAIGEGIAQRLQEFEVAFEPGAAPAILKGADGDWTLIDATLDPFAAALACNNSSPILQTFSLASI